MPSKTASFMALTPGTRLGPYEVTAQIGVGGLGEVYRVCVWERRTMGLPLRSGGR